MNADIKGAALALVRSHVEVDPNLRRVLLYNDPAAGEVRLLEIVQGSPNAGDVLPFRFAADPSRGVAFPVVVIELSPEEFARVEAGDELKLPSGWEGYEEVYSAA